MLDLKIPFEHLEKLFPFCFIVEENGKIIHQGASIKKILKRDTQQHFDDVFSFIRPTFDKLPTDLSEHQNEMIIIKDLKMGHQFMGQILSYKEKKMHLFVVSLFVQTIDELKPVGLSFNDFAIQDQIFDFLMLLQTHRKSIREADHLNKKLADAHKIAVQASEMKTQFLANISHELRTPMNGVLGMASVLAETKLDSNQKEYLQCIASSGESMLNLINDILDISKIESGHINLHRERFDLHSFMEELVKSTEPLSQKKKLDFELKLNISKDKKISTDKNRLRQVLINLIGNSIKFTESGFVKIEVQELGQNNGMEKFEFKIKDTGIGMSQETVAKIFTPFVQGDGSMTKKYGGTGLGLSISKKLVQAMGGEITVVSQINEGSLFTFNIESKL